MIKAEFFTQDGKITGFSLNGHADSAPKGYDIYCAGVSTLSDSAYLCITNYLKREIDGEHGEGKLFLKLKTPPDSQTEAVFHTMLIGLTEIEKQAPKILKVIIK